MEKLINEFRIIETDDGFRIEIKGDKDKIRGFLSEMKKHRHMAHGPRSGGFPFPPWMAWKAAHCHAPWDFEVEQESEPGPQA